jgi:hypothetical protein
MCVAEMCCEGKCVDLSRSVWTPSGRGDKVMGNVKNYS